MLFRSLGFSQCVAILSPRSRFTADSRCAGPSEYNRPEKNDAALVKVLKAAGAIPFVKTNVPQTYIIERSDCFADFQLTTLPQDARFRMLQPALWHDQQSLRPHQDLRRQFGRRSCSPRFRRRPSRLRQRHRRIVEDSCALFGLLWPQALRRKVP